MRQAPAAGVWCYAAAFLATAQYRVQSWLCQWHKVTGTYNAAAGRGGEKELGKGAATYTGPCRVPPPLVACTSGTPAPGQGDDICFNQLRAMSADLHCWHAYMQAAACLTGSMTLCISSSVSTCLSTRNLPRQAARQHSHCLCPHEQWFVNCWPVPTRRCGTSHSPVEKCSSCCLGYSWCCCCWWWRPSSRRLGQTHDRHV